MNRSTFLIAFLLSATTSPATAQETLEQQLLAEGSAELAVAARRFGDPRRGAILFYQQHMLCTKCHAAGDGPSPLGPDLTKIPPQAPDIYLVESLLEPSKVIKLNFETVSLITVDGKSLTGLLKEKTANAVQLLDAARIGDVITIPNEDIEELVPGEKSVMPSGLMNLLTSRQQFLDLTKYIMELRDGGALAAATLKPAPHLYAVRPLPEYEKHIDHAGLLTSWDQESFQRGEAIYKRLCINCHGTKDQPGSLPTSRRFASEAFKNGADPYSQYQTLTRGFGMMIAQTWMVPEQKYDVIHYIREAYLKPHNPSQLTEITDEYLASLPAGDTRGPKPSAIKPWSQMDYGPSLVHTYEIGNDGSNFAYKGIAMRLDAGGGGVAKGRHWMIFDHDTMRVAAAWSGQGFIDYNGIMFNGRHGVHPRIVGNLEWENKTGPGWGDPDTGSFEDPRLRGRDDRAYGPLPRPWAQYKGLYHHGQRTMVSYTVGKADVLESPALTTVGESNVYERHFNIGPRDKDMVLQVARGQTSGASLRTFASKDWQVAVWGKQSGVGKVVTNPTTTATTLDAHDGFLVAGVSTTIQGIEWLTTEQGDLRLKIPAGKVPLHFVVWTARTHSAVAPEELAAAVRDGSDRFDPAKFTAGGPARWPAKIKTRGHSGEDDRAFAVDVFTRPAVNPWFCQVRFGGFDFLPNGTSAIISTWDGDVWKVDGIDTNDELTWQRIASGLFQPLGVRYVDGKVYLTCRDQLCVLHDLNGDWETDYYECFNNDHQVTDHFHEFAMGLQTDAEGNFYYAKSARHALKALVPHHGTLLKVSKDGQRTEIVANGFRAANGVCLNPDGTFIVTDQEGHWNPKNRINWVHQGGFYGNMFGYHDVTDSSDEAMEQPLCWITNSFDRSPAELLWVDPRAKWGPLNGSLLNLSYGYGKVYVVPFEDIDGQKQGGMCELPIPQFPTGVMRGRFHPVDGQLYACGMFAWAGSQNQPGGFYRVRYTGKPAHLPVGLHATKQGMSITFTEAVDPGTATDAANYEVRVWDLKRTASYGSKHYNEKSLKVADVRVSSDGRTVQLVIPDIAPTWCMSIRYALQDASGESFNGLIHNTVHRLR